MQDIAASLKSMIPHNVKSIPNKFRVHQYYRKAHVVVQRLFRKYNLNGKIDVNDFFALVVMHDADHINFYKSFCDRVPLRASNEHSVCSFYWSMYRNCILQQFWVPPIINPLWPLYIRNSREPFFQELYRDLARIDRELADMARYTITF